jgi:uncharacterized HAD superfamily protein
MLIAIDIDGTLTENDEDFINIMKSFDSDSDYHEYYKNLKPDILAIKKVISMSLGGNIIVLWTSRPEKDREITEEWLKKYEIPYCNLVMDKLRVDLYIDNDSVRMKDLHLATDKVNYG